MQTLTATEFDKVNRAVNRETDYYCPPAADYKWESSDDLIGPTGRPRGMCADQAIAKYERLALIGQPRDAMRFAIVGVEKPGDHMILCANDGEKWWALDIRFPDLMAPSALPYSWQCWGKDFEQGSWTTVDWS